MANFFDKLKKQKQPVRTAADGFDLPKPHYLLSTPSPVRSVLFVVDASAAMGGDRIAAINAAISKTVSYVLYLGALKPSITKSSLKFGIMAFSDHAQWLTQGPESPTPSYTCNIPCGGDTNWSCALTALNEKLSDTELFSGEVPCLPPLICFISNGCASDDLSDALAALNKNPWYKKAEKIAVTTDKSFDSKTLFDVIGCDGTIVSIGSADGLKKTLGGICADYFHLAIDRQPLNAPKQEFDSDAFASTCILGPETPSNPNPVVKTTCRCCGASVEASRRFCLYCGTAIGAGASPQAAPSFASTPTHQIMPTPTPSAAKVNVSQVQFSAVVPKRLIKGEYGMIEIAVYEEDYRHIVKRLIANAEDEVREVVGSMQNIEDNTVIRIKLSSPDLDMADCEEAQKWYGKYLTFSFPVDLPIDYAKKQILFIATVYFNDVIATRLKFVASCNSLREHKLNITRKDVLTAFISYASQDRSRVATIIQGMKKARPDMDIFFDVENLKSGELWERILRSEIEKRDVLFLCWSEFASRSEWVEKEWRYALKCNGIESIEPVPLVSPAECPPPAELNGKHFNDRALLYAEHSKREGDLSGV